MRVAPVIGMLAFSGCMQNPATEDQLRVALTDCGIHKFEIRSDWDDQPAWYFSPATDEVNDGDLDCVRDQLGKHNAKANFVDREVADGNSEDHGS